MEDYIQNNDVQPLILLQALVVLANKKRQNDEI